MTVPGYNSLSVPTDALITNVGGAKHISLKTGAFRPTDLARALKFCSKAKVDLLTVDGAGGGTGMSL